MAGNFKATFINGINGTVSAGGSLGDIDGGESHLLSKNSKMNGASRKAKDSQIDGPALDESPIYESTIPPIAIVGMGMRLPGGVSDADTFWELLRDKRDGRCRVPKNRYNVDAFYSSSGKPGTVKTQHGYFLEDVDLQNFDASCFSMNRSEIERLDPQQRLLLEVVLECMENGGQTDWRGKKIGCYVGSFGQDWFDLSAKDTLNTGLYRTHGSEDFALANRISYEYDLSGPRLPIPIASVIAPG